MSEIDDIFANKTKAKQKQKPSTSSLPPQKSKDVKDSSSKKSQPKSKNLEESPSKKRPLPDTVVDVSADLAGPSKRHKKDTIPNKNGKPKNPKKNNDKLTDFEDSRGSGDRKSIYLTF